MYMIFIRYSRSSTALHLNLPARNSEKFGSDALKLYVQWFAVWTPVGFNFHGLDLQRNKIHDCASKVTQLCLKRHTKSCTGNWQTPEM